jgi:hypothetical protein
MCSRHQAVGISACNQKKIEKNKKICKDQLRPPAYAVLVKRVGAPKDVGMSILLKDCKKIVRSGNVLKTDYGTLQKGWGTAIAFEIIPQNISKIFQNLFILFGLTQCARDQRCAFEILAQTDSSH